MRKPSAMWWLLLPVLLFGVAYVDHDAQRVPGGWRNASREPVGLAPDPATTPEGIIQVYAARTVRWRGWFSVHTWIAAKPAGADSYTVYEVTGWRLRRAGTAVSTSDRAPDGRWFGTAPDLIAELRGPDVDAAIERIEAAVREYPYADRYRIWPGPNSNTFTAFVLRAVPELRADLPPTAIGKDYLGPRILARSPSGTGGQLSVLGVLGVLAGIEEGLEINLLGLTFGIDPKQLAIKLPLAGRLGLIGAVRADEPPAARETPAGATGEEGEASTRRQFTFSWPFLPDDAMRPRGGSTTGAAVTLHAGPTPEWQALREPGLSAFERDRRAILAMAGGYRTSFDFIETVGFTADFAPARPYQSWGTEHVYVVADEGEAISLQHIMVMFFTDAAGATHGPIVQKHWRQDWRYEDRNLHDFAGRDRWRRRTLEADAAVGKWTQAVYQVDDSPRYEAAGAWVHDANYSAWTSEPTWRPLPRRESTVRNDYHVLVGTNRHTITPTGWVQEEENLKVALDENGGLAAGSPYLARELGVNRYERIVDFDFSAGDRYWERTRAFWQEVRAAWAEIGERNTVFTFREEIDGRGAFVPMFEYAARLEAGEAYDASDARAFIRATLEDFVEEP